MGLVLELQDERGTPVEEAVMDEDNLLHEVIPPPEDESYQCLRFIDWYGDTTFNRLQMRRFIREIDRLRCTTSAPKEHKLLDQIRALATRCQREVHLYVKFIGD